MDLLWVLWEMGGPVVMVMMVGGAGNDGDEVVDGKRGQKSDEFKRLCLPGMELEQSIQSMVEMTNFFVHVEWELSC